MKYMLMPIKAIAWKANDLHVFEYCLELQEEKKQRLFNF